MTTNFAGRMPTADQIAYAHQIIALAHKGYPETVVRVRDGVVEIHQPLPTYAMVIVHGMHNPTVREWRGESGHPYRTFSGHLYPGDVYPIAVVMDADDSERLAAWVAEVTT